MKPGIARFIWAVKGAAIGAAFVMSGAGIFFELFFDVPVQPIYDLASAIIGGVFGGSIAAAVVQV